jgi:hypothetical protein
MPPLIQTIQIKSCSISNRKNALTMSEAAVVGEGTEVNKGENARMASFVGALAIGEYCHFSPPHTYFSYIFFSKFKTIATRLTILFFLSSLVVFGVTLRVLPHVVPPQPIL